MDQTSVRRRTLSALVVGASPENVLRVMTAFEQRHIVPLREDTIAAACDRMASDMPAVALVLVPPASDAERDKLAECALAVGTVVVHAAPKLDAAAFDEVLERSVQAALAQNLLREEAEIVERAADASTIAPEELDEGWGE